MQDWCLLLLITLLACQLHSHICYHSVAFAGGASGGSTVFFAAAAAAASSAAAAAAASLRAAHQLSKNPSWKKGMGTTCTAAMNGSPWLLPARGSAHKT
jgi:hypothetical protein